MGEDELKKMLKNLNITETEMEIYLYLSRYPLSKGTEISRQTKKDKAQIYHLLKSLQTKGLVETTLESPVRYIPVPLGEIVDSLIQAKRNEAQRIEKTKQEVLTYWKTLNKKEVPQQVEKFIVIDGRKKVNAKISQMVTESKTQLSAITTIQNLLRAEQEGLFDVASKHPLKTQIQFRFLTEFSSKNLTPTKNILKKMSRTGFNFRGRNPDLHSTLSPELIIKDDDETLFFIRPRIEDLSVEDNVCLWTNCKSLVQTFTGVFEDLWQNSRDIYLRISEIETGKSPVQTGIIKNPEAARKKYSETLDSAKKEIVIVTSADGLMELHAAELVAWKKAGVFTRIMAPITRRNFETVQELSNYGEIRHVSNGYLGTTVVDGKYLFQFKISVDNEKAPRFEDIFYTSELEHVGKTSKMLEEMWKKAQAPSVITLDSIAGATIASASDHVVYKATKKMLKHTVMEDLEASKNLTEKSVIEKIINAQKNLHAPAETDIVTFYTVNGQAIIHPPSQFNLPVTLFHTYHIEKHSTYGAEDAMIVHLWLKTLDGEAFVPCAVITDNPKSMDFWRKALEGTPAKENLQLIKKNELEACIHGNTLFVGWTIPITLLYGKHAIPPSCLQFEGYGDIKTNAYRAIIPSGYLLKTEGNILEAFVTFLHPKSKYSGPGTDGAFGRDVIIEFYPPK